MLYETLSQPWVFLIILWYGILLGSISKLGQIVCKYIAKAYQKTKHSTSNKFAKKSKKVVKNSKKHRNFRKKRNFFVKFSENFTEFVVAIIIGSAYIVINYFYNYGEIRLFTILAYVLGLVIGIYCINFFTGLILNFCKNKNGETKQV